MSHKFKLGQRVRRAHIGYTSEKAGSGDVFEVVRLMPEDQTGEPSYRIRAGVAERAARESELAPAFGA